MPSAFEFGEFRLDRQAFRLTRAGFPLRLERKPLELLILLVERNGELVSRTEIAQRLWGAQVYVDVEHGINTAVRKVRHALRDDSEAPQFIETVTGKGYRFLAPVQLRQLNGATPARSEPEENGALAHLPNTAPVIVPSPETARKRSLPVLRRSHIAAAAILLLLVGAAAFAIYRDRYRRPEVEYTQLTDLADSAVAPAISPDGRLLAFVRSAQLFLSSGPIYLQPLPNGQPRLLIDDRRPKYALHFSPDGSQVVYTVLGVGGFSAYAVSVFGGDPLLVLHNAAGLSWLDNDRLLFSSARSGIHLGLVTGTQAEGAQHDLYFPAHERGMVHDAHVSPNRKWALITEMDGAGDWAQCRLVPLDGSARTRLIGPQGGCLAADWSPDGRWMYLVSVVEQQSHLWRQRFPDGAPQQITFGPTEEDGLAVDSRGGIITSVGTHDSTLWMHEPAGDRPISAEGEVVSNPVPRFVQHGSVLYYLALRKTGGAEAELWRYTPATGRREVALPGIRVLAYDVAADRSRIAYTTPGADGASELWTVPADGSAPAVRWRTRGAMSPHFAPDGSLYAVFAEGRSNYIARLSDPGASALHMLPYQVLEFTGVSPGGRWLMAGLHNLPNNPQPATAAIPVDGGAPVRLCASYCFPIWSADGRFLYIGLEDAAADKPGRSIAIPVGDGESLPPLPPGGIAQHADVTSVPGAISVASDGVFAPGGPDRYAYVRTTVHRNLYWLTLHERR